MFTLLVRRADESVAVIRLTRDDGRLTAGPQRVVPSAALPDEIRAGEKDSTRWVWDDTFRWYPRLLAAGLRVERCVDLRLVHGILRRSEFTAGNALHGAPVGPWDAPQAAPTEADALFVVEPESLPDALGEFLRQRDAVETSAQRSRLELLTAAESTGALVAVEMRHRGIPWSAARHDELLTDVLGPRPSRAGDRPARMLDDLAAVRAALRAPDLNPDSPAELIRALRTAGLTVTSTRQWELQHLEHPVIEPLLRYKKKQRLLVANGWSWLEAWVRDGRFRPEYVPAAAATGRWGTSGGGALQLPRAVRGAVVADPGWALVVADASQLEPRVLTALSQDGAMARAGEGDLYEGIVASGAVATRAEAKVAMLGAMYGATQGDGGRLMPRLTRAFPRAIALVEAAARVGEHGGVVSTLLGRSSPRPGSDAGFDERPPEDGPGQVDGGMRAWGRFTRNFVVQGTAAEWALCWMGALRRSLTAEFGAGSDAPHLVFFLHDEVVVHTPASVAPRVAALMESAATEAGRLLFGDAPVRFPVTVATVTSY
ncbi:bifunctional 3'-5' exonuclease/DNA polymerase [Frondihabitans sp. PAMC 28766]|uniref:bifunctional 3'-5' exonuclease/DNA polymerase n=1 Tax=Frondihabitans sp. PAMC 28766 TaxID=1795630 RepID=UPI00078C9CE6|nr:bifunctional 3'-5' exonuclease/DNA polymerase [Frondihabitans sp. PAMC 28766]AMM21004.1 bifunctional 3'-5' exonuclease/DNA polymerase [Frondihabitans sp. PAMC 28766]